MVKEIVIYGKNECKYCVKSKWMFKTFVEKYGYIMKYVELEKDNKVYLKELIGEFTTVPQIIVNGVHIGGYNEFIGWIERNIW